MPYVMITQEHRWLVGGVNDLRSVPKKCEASGSIQRYWKCTSEQCWRWIVQKWGQAQNISSSGQSSGKYGKSYLWVSKCFLEECINWELLQRNLHSLRQFLRSNLPSLSINVGSFLRYFSVFFLKNLEIHFFLLYTYDILIQQACSAFSLISLPPS